jgi:hypothetical protein
VLGVIFDGTGEIVDELIGHLITSRGQRGRYWRFQTEISGATLDLDDVSKRNIARLLELAEDLVSDRKGELTEITHALVHRSA